MTEVTIHTLPFRVFKKIILTGDLKLLGEGPELELAALWEELLEQYADAIGEGNKDGYLSTRRELLYFQTQKYLVHFLVDQLSRLYVPKWAELLNKITRGNFKFNPHNREEYYNLLERSLKRAKSMDFQIRTAEGKLKEMEKRSEGSSLKPSEEFFAKILLNLHEWSNWQFDDDQISTFQYCELVRRYHQHIEYLQTKKQDGGRKRA